MRTPMLIALLAFAAACGGPELTVSPASGPSFGHFAVRAEGAGISKLKEPLAVSVGGIAAYGVARDGSQAVKFTVQGSPAAGANEVVVTGADGATVKGARISYDPPRDPRFSRFVAFGASLTMGCQDGTFSMRSQLRGPAVQVARSAGAFLAVPLVKDGYLASVTLDDRDPATCRLKTDDIFALLQQRIESSLIPKLSDSRGDMHVDWARLDPRLTATNIAIGGFRIGESVNGGSGALELAFQHFVWDPFSPPGKLFSPTAETMLDRLVALHPSVVMTTDVFGNDFDNVDIHGDAIPALTALTSLADFQASLDRLMAAFDQTGAEVFIANGPDLTVLPSYEEKVAKLRAAGFSEADATGWRDAIRARIVEYNTALATAAASRPRVHVVDFATLAAEIFANGIDVAGTHLGPKPMGGLFSLDDLHFSDTGYALLARAYVRAMNEAWGAKLPEPDLAAVYRDDPMRPEALRAAGFACAGE
jgi:lysophospholipase L1-like esterase